MRKSKESIAVELFDAKLRTGLYDHYDEDEKAVLFDDCVRQAAMMDRCNEKRK
ncbi:hypothetical protein [Anaerotignum sp.]